MIDINSAFIGQTVYLAGCSYQACFGSMDLIGEIVAIVRDKDTPDRDYLTVLFDTNGETFEYHPCLLYSQERFIQRFYQSDFGRAVFRLKFVQYVFQFEFFRDLFVIRNVKDFSTFLKHWLRIKPSWSFTK